MSLRTQSSGIVENESGLKNSFLFFTQKLNVHSIPSFQFPYVYWQIFKLYFLYFILLFNSYKYVYACVVVIIKIFLTTRSLNCTSFISK